jgi:hypothetical protein
VRRKAALAALASPKISEGDRSRIRQITWFQCA